MSDEILFEIRRGNKIFTITRNGDDWAFHQPGTGALVSDGEMTLSEVARELFNMTIPGGRYLNDVGRLEAKIEAKV